MNDLILSESDIAVKQANSLIESIYKMDLTEHRLLLLATKKVNKMELMGEEFNERTKITISCAEFAKQYDLDLRNAFDMLVAAKLSIYEKEFTFLYLNKQTGIVEPMKSRWFQARGVDKAKSEISFMFASAVIPLIYLVEKEYTLLDLDEIGKLKSKYAVRLYKFLMRWLNAPYKNQIPIDKMRNNVFRLESDEYPRMTDFKKRVLDVAVKQVGENTGFKGLTAKTHKSGVKVSGFSFHYDNYENDLIKGKKATQPIEGTAVDVGDYVIYQMTIKQIDLAVGKIISACRDQKLDGFEIITSMAESGQEWDVIESKLKSDFRNGVFEPYYDVLKIIGFKPSKTNKTPPEGKQGENGAIPEGDPVTPKQKPVKAAPKPAENEQLDIFGRVFRGTKARTIASNMLKQAFAEDNPIFSDIKERMELGNHTQLVNEIMADLEAGNLEKYEAELRYFESRRML